MAEHNEIGKIGENITRTFLMKHGFSVIHTNYFTRYGELDIVAEKDNRIRFVEVKSVKVRDIDSFGGLKVRPEENITRDKWNGLVTSAETYLKHTASRFPGENAPRWQIDLACVYINTETREGRVVLMENIHMD